MRHIGLLGGSFNPVHSGHLLATESVFKQMKLDQIWFLPAAQSPFKEKPGISDAHRIAMLQRAVAAHPAFKIDARELSAARPSYTIRTLRSLAADFPDDRFYLLIGMDAWQHFEHWHEWQKILDLCHLVVMTRPGYPPPTLSPYWQARQLEQVDAIKAKHAGQLFFAIIPPSRAASNTIRTRIRQMRSTENDLPASVERYIKKQKLYQ